MSLTSYLITGGNRGIGLGLVSALLSRDNTLVIATVRDVASESSKKLHSLPKGANSRIVVLKIDSTIETDPAQAMIQLTSEYHVDKLDVVIANAGISNYYGPATTTPLKEVHDHYFVNVVGPLALFQATFPLLEKSSSPKFVPLTTLVASMTAMGSLPLQTTAYGASKAALNYITRKIHFENEKLIAFPISPGSVAKHRDRHSCIFC